MFSQNKMNVQFMSQESLQDFKYNSDRQLSDLNLGLRRLESQHKDVSKQLEQQPSEAKLRLERVKLCRHHWCIS